MNDVFIATQIPLEHVRWFYSYQGSRGQVWKKFRGNDSINLERAYRVRSGQNPDSISQTVVVRGDLYEVDIVTMLCTPIFWSGQKRSTYTREASWCTTNVLRSVWFHKVNWVPLDSELAEAIEMEHVSTVLPLLLRENEGKKKRIVHRFFIKGYSVTWKSDGEVFLVAKSVKPFSRLKIRAELSSIPISRGYKDVCSIDDRLPEITHLCFVVHGIGQQLGSVRHECDKLRKTFNKVVDKLYPKLAMSNQRLEFLPVDWRSHLNLNSETLDNITVGQMRPLRSYINHCFVDVLYYTSPIYRAQIMRSLSWELTRLYNLFLFHHPTFLQNNGQVSVLAHSLGSVIMHDVLRSVNTTLSFAKQDDQSDMAESNAPSFERSSSHITELAQQVEKARNDLLNLELQLMKDLSRTSQITGQSTSSSFLTTFRRPAAWKSLPQLSNLFLIGSPLALFVMLNGVPCKPINQLGRWSSSVSSRSSSSSPGGIKSVRLSNLRNSRSNSSESGSDFSPMELDHADIDILIPSTTCRRVYNIFHSYDPIAYRLEPLLLKHYSSITPAILSHPNAHYGKKFFKRRADAKLTKDMNDKLRTMCSEVSQSSMNLNDEYTGSGQSVSTTMPGVSTRPSELDNESLISSETSGSSKDTSEDPDEAFDSTIRRMTTLPEPAETYKQHKSKTMRFFSRYVTRRSSHVTNLGPQITHQRSEPNKDEKRLNHRIDYEWQKSFSPLAMINAHYSYWDSSELGFFIAHQIFGEPTRWI